MIEMKTYSEGYTKRLLLNKWKCPWKQTSEKNEKSLNAKIYTLQYQNMF